MEAASTLNPATARILTHRYALRRMAMTDNGTRPKHLPPTGHVLVHDSGAMPRVHFFWRMAGKKFVVCDCRRRPDLGEHYKRADPAEGT
jgi:hypothetical protein